MKKTITVVALLAGAVTGYSQGQIQMFDYGSAFAIQVFAAHSGATTAVQYGGVSGFETQGNTIGNDNPGTTTYPGAPIPGGYDIELLAGPAGSSLAALTPVASSLVVTWEPNGAGSAGYWNTAVDAVIPGITTTATVAIACWSSTYATLAAAEASGVSGVWGISDAATTAPLGFGTTQPPTLPAGLTSFSLATTVPEPSTIALGVIGASAFLMRLRRKQ